VAARPSRSALAAAIVHAVESGDSTPYLERIPLTSCCRELIAERDRLRAQVEVLAGDVLDLSGERDRLRDLAAGLEAML